MRTQYRMQRLSGRPIENSQTRSYQHEKFIKRLDEEDRKKEQTKNPTIKTNEDK